MQRQNNRELRPFAKFAFHAQAAAVTIDDVLDDSQAQPGSAKRAVAVAVGALISQAVSWFTKDRA